MRKRRFGRLAALVMALACLAMLLCGASFDIPSDSWVMDDANILSAQTEQYVNERTKVLSDACGAQIGVATVEYTGSLSVEDYAYQLANEWGLGDSKKNNGVLLLLVPGEDDYRCIQGSGLERTLPTSTLSTILRSDMEPNWVKGDYDTGVQETVLHFCRILRVTGEKAGSRAQHDGKKRNTPVVGMESRRRMDFITSTTRIGARVRCRWESFRPIHTMASES